MQKLKITRAEKTAWSMNDIMVPAYMVTMVAELDATGLERLRAIAKANGGRAPSYTAIVMKIAAMVMINNPSANRAVLGPPFFRSLFQFNNVDISVAIEKNLPYNPGLSFAPTLRNTFEKSLIEITEELQVLAKCDETNHEGFALYMKVLKSVPRPFSNLLLTLPHYIPSLWIKYRGCAAWVNAPSRAGADLVLTTWPWPITFSFGIVKMRPIVIDDRVEARPTIPVVMVFDRRIMGGGPASRIFAEFQEIIEKADIIFASEFDELQENISAIRKDQPSEVLVG